MVCIVCRTSTEIPDLEGKRGARMWINEQFGTCSIMVSYVMALYKRAEMKYGRPQGQSELLAQKYCMKYLQ